MDNILGNGFDKYVIDQVNQRQTQLGIVEGIIPDNTLLWSHENNAWLRLASSINIISSSIDSGGDGVLSQNSDLLAKENILFGGTSIYNNGNIILKGGLNSYDDSSFGYRPMASLIGADLTYLNNNGSLIRANIQIKAYSPEQFDIIDKLYMRLGYSILLEWGHVYYIDNTGNKQEFTNFSTLPFTKFFTFGTNKQDIYDAIKKERSTYNGNYDGFLGQIVKFNWSFEPKDASYNINIEAISPGVIVESLRINTSLKKEDESKLNKEDKPYAVEFKNASRFHSFLYDAYNIAIPEDNKVIETTPQNQQILEQSQRRVFGGL